MNIDQCPLIRENSWLRPGPASATPIDLLAHEHLLDQNQQLSKLTSALNQQLNDSQFRAICNAAIADGVTLIQVRFIVLDASTMLRNERAHESILGQGPPGTGKTRTIVALASLLLAKQRFSSSAPTAPMSTGSMPTFRPVTASNRLARVLICAPSNAAVDEIALRIKRGGLINEHGERFEPSIVRLGAASSVTIEEVRELCLDQITVQVLRQKRQDSANQAPPSLP